MCTNNCVCTQRSVLLGLSKCGRRNSSQMLLCKVIFITLLEVKAKVDEITGTLNQYLSGKDMEMM